MSADDTQPAHARLGPSGADRWMVCYGAPNAEEGLPNNPSEYAAEGTAGHFVADECLSNPLGYSPFDFVGEIFHIEGWDIEFTEDMAEDLLPGIEWIRAQEGRFFGEHKVDLSRWLGEGQFGTLDRGIISDNEIIIIDLKFGRGIPVSPVRNRQLMLYALGFWWNVARHLTKATTIRIIIDQPRCAGGGGEWVTTLDDLLAFGEEATRAAQATHDPFAPRVASEKGCLFCKRRTAPGGCETYDAFNLDLIGAKFEDLDDPDVPPSLPSRMTPERRSYVVQHCKMIEKWIENLHTETLADALAGNPTPRLKAVDGRRSRSTWRDKEAVDDALEPLLGARRFGRQLITPKQAAILISPEDYELAVLPLVKQGSTKPILVPEEDAREAIVPYDAKFDEVDEDEI